MATKDRVLYQCVEPFAVWNGRIPDVYGQDRMVLADDPILRTHRAHFVAAADRVEQATSGPGERRAVFIPEPEPASDPAVPEPDVVPDPEAQPEEENPNGEA